MKWFVLAPQLESNASGGRFLLAVACTLALLFGWALAIYGAIYVASKISPHWVGVIACLAVIAGMSYIFVHIMIPNGKTHSNREKEG